MLFSFKALTVISTYAFAFGFLTLSVFFFIVLSSITKTLKFGSLKIKLSTFTISSVTVFLF